MGVHCQQPGVAVVAISNVLYYRDIYFDWNCQLVATLTATASGSEFRIHLLPRTRPAVHTMAVEFLLVVGITLQVRVGSTFRWLHSITLSIDLSNRLYAFLQDADIGQRLNLIDRTNGRRQLSWVVHDFNWDRIGRQPRYIKEVR